MYERKAKTVFRSGTALCFALLLVSGGWGITARAAEVGTAPAMTSVQTLIPVGHTIGIKLYSRGVLVVDLSEGSTPARSAGLQKGDVILKCGGTSVSSTEQFQSLLKNGQGKAVELQVRRDNRTSSISLTPEKNDQGNWCIGAWIRDSMAGIGTMTFYDPASGVFGALGHGITDLDTAQLMPFSSGGILPSTVKAVRPGEIGAAGELRGDFDLTRDLGTLYANTDGGIFGTLEDESFSASLGQALPVADNNEIQVGPAKVLANVSGDEVREYDVEITKIMDENSDSRNMLVTVTDPELLSATGGIVQGMSGSPLIQNGKIIGAVTHVLLNDPTRGYGIFIRNMLNFSQITMEKAG